MKYFMTLIFVASFFISLSSVYAYQEKDIANKERSNDIILELFDVMEMKKLYEDTVDEALKAQLAANPSLAEKEKQMRKFFEKYISFEALKDDLIKIYCKYYTDEDIKGLIAFYKTPLGKKVLKQTPQIASESMLIGQKAVQDNMAELIKMLEEPAEVE